MYENYKKDFVNKFIFYNHFLFKQIFPKYDNNNSKE